MRTFARLLGLAGLFLALGLILPAPRTVQAQAGGSLSGVVVPDLPPEVSSGEEVSFTPPPGSEGGTWTLCGVVAAPEEDPGPQEPEGARPAAAQLGLRPAAALPPLSEEQAVGLAVAAAMQQPSWAACLSGRPGAGERPAVAGDPLPDVDVALERKPGPYALQVVVSEMPREQAMKAAEPIDKGKGLDKDKPTLVDQAATDLRNLAGADAGVRYFGIDIQPSGQERKSFFESRSNTANKRSVSGGALGSGQEGSEGMTLKSFYESRSNRKPETVAGYSIPLPGDSGKIAAGNVLVASFNGLFDEGELPPVVVAVAMVSQKASEPVDTRGRDKGVDGRSVTFAPVQCQSSAGPREAPQAARGHETAMSAVRNIKALVVKIPRDLKPGQAFPVSYKDPSGRTVLNVDDVEGVHVVPPRPRPADPRPRLDAVPEYSIAGRSVCACGYFPDARSRGGLLFDERAVQPLSASSWMAILPLPATVAPGRHPISASQEAGFAEKVVYTNVVQINGRLDANKLRSGQATQMELVVVGTDKPLPLRIVNKTPRVISIGGQVDQTLTTSGGNPNRLVQTVNSVGPGNFGIDFSLAADRCPCQSQR